MSFGPQQLVLASTSPRRRELLERMQLQFETCAADVEEDNVGLSGPAEMVRSNALLKANAVAPQYPEALVLGSDTTVALGDEILNKPKDMPEAKEMLLRLAGRPHTVYTAVALIWKQGNFVDCFVEPSEVTFKAFDAQTVEAYFAVVNPLDKAGAYGIQQAREMIIESVDGSVANVMGLPVESLEQRLSEHVFDFRV